MSRAVEKRTVKFGPEAIIAELERVDPPNHDVLKVLLEFPKAFSIAHTPNLKQPNYREGYGLARFDGPGHFVWLGTDPLEYAAKQDNNPEGLFSLDRERNRVLYNPAQAIPIRDSYHGHANFFGTQYSFPELLAGLESGGVRFFQVSEAREHILKAQNQGLIAQELVVHLMNLTGAIYGAGRAWKGPGFVIDGSLPLSEILAGKRLPKREIDFKLPQAQLRKQLTQDW